MNSLCLQVAIKNSIDVFYLSTSVPLHVLFTEDGEMDKKIFLSTWKDIPSQNEMQYTIKDVPHNAGEFFSLYFVWFSNTKLISKILCNTIVIGNYVIGSCCGIVPSHHFVLMGKPIFNFKWITKHY